MQIFFRVVLIAVITSIILLRLIVSSFNARFVFSDLPEFYAAARLVLEGRGADVYSPEVIGALQHQLFPELGERIIPLFLPPTALTLIAPIGLLPLDSVFPIWLAILFVALVASVVILARTFQLPAKQTVWVFAVLCASGPALEALRIGQLSPLLLLVFSCALWAVKSNKPWLVGLLLALMLVKPQDVAPVIVLFIGVGRWKELGWLLGFAMAIFAVSIVFFGFDSYSNYWQLLNHTYRDAWMQPEVCATVRGQLLRFTGMYSSMTNIANMLGTVVMILASAAIFAVGRAYKNSAQWLEFGLIGALPLGLLVSPHLYNYELILLLPAAISLVVVRKNVSIRQAAGCVLFVFSLLTPVYMPIYYGYVLKGEIINPLFLSFAYCAACTFVVMLKNRPLKAQKAA